MLGLPSFARFSYPVRMLTLPATPPFLICLRVALTPAAVVFRILLFMRCVILPTLSKFALMICSMRNGSARIATIATHAPTGTEGGCGF